MRQDIKGDCYLITLDHHTDTNPSYLRSLFKQVGRDLPQIEKLRQHRINSIHISDQHSVIAACEGLYHDEHIDVALRCGIFKTAFVIQHSHYKLLPEWIENNMVVWPTEFDLHGATAQVKRDYYDLALEDVFLQRQLRQLPESFSLESSPYILDIDMDYFKTQQSLRPSSRSVIRQLVKGAIGVTIAQESEWVRRLYLDEPMAPSEMLAALCAVLEN